MNKKLTKLAKLSLALALMTMFGISGWGQEPEPIVDGGIYLLKWDYRPFSGHDCYVQRQNNGNTRILDSKNNGVFWYLEKVTYEGEEFYRIKSYDDDTRYIYLDNSVTGPVNENAIKNAEYDDSNPTLYLFKFEYISDEGLYVIVPYRFKDDTEHHYSFYKDKSINDHCIGLRTYEEKGDFCLWDLIQAGEHYVLSPPIINGESLITKTGDYTYRKPTCKYYLYLGDYLYSTPSATYAYAWTTDPVLPSSTSQDPGQPLYFFPSNGTLRVNDLTPRRVTLTCTATATVNNRAQVVEFSDFVVTIGSPTEISSLSEITDPYGHYILTQDVDASGFTTIDNFSGYLDGNFKKITGLTQPLFGTVEDATVRNMVFDDIAVTGDGNVGAVAKEATGCTRIYNCGILATTGSTVAGTNYVGGLVGRLDGMARVINCYSYANITGGTEVAGIVGYQAVPFVDQNNIRTMIVNCMFYGDITGGTTKYPIYGGYKIVNNTTLAINHYDYFYEDASFADSYTTLEQYDGALPASKDDLTRVEFYRSILNSNRRLCVTWISGHSCQNQTQDELDMIAKWVLDPEIAPYPILKPWGKYASVINPDPEKIWDGRTEDENGNALTPHWVYREAHDGQEPIPYQGKKLGTLTVNVNAGVHNNNATLDEPLELPILDMDTLNHDYCYAKVQLPYYNEWFGNPNATTHAEKYGNNYTDMVVTGWKITDVTLDGTVDEWDYYEFNEDLDGGYDFANRYCYEKDLYDVSGRVFAQGGYYYVPAGVSAITLEAYWGKAVYLANSNRDIDKVNVPSMNSFGLSGQYPNPPEGFHGRKIYTSIKDAINNTNSGEQLSSYSANYGEYHQPPVTVYDQAVVLLTNFQMKMNNNNTDVMGPSAIDVLIPYTITSVDLDFDNEPDCCFEMQYSTGTSRGLVHPIRFDFLPVPSLGMAIRNSDVPWTIGHMKPLGHFEITETSFMEMTEFEYDVEAFQHYNGFHSYKEEAPLIINGGRYDKFLTSHSPVSSYPPELNNTCKKTRYIILGGHIQMDRFAPGPHPENTRFTATRHCPVSVMGGEFGAFYLSGMQTEAMIYGDNPYCYINGGKFGEMTGAGMEQVGFLDENNQLHGGNVWFNIDHALIREFYGGGINAEKPVLGMITVYISNSRVKRYCGGPKFCDIVSNETCVMTEATNTHFGIFYGAGYGGTSFNRLSVDENHGNTVAEEVDWDEWFNTGDKKYTPFGLVLKDNKVIGCEAQYDYEFWNIPSGSSNYVVARLFKKEAIFSTTETGYVNSKLVDCVVERDCYGGGCYGAVGGNYGWTQLSLTNSNIGGSVYGGGYSRDALSFYVYDKEHLDLPSRDATGVCNPGSYPEEGKTLVHWTNDDNGGTANYFSHENPTETNDDYENAHYTKTENGVVKHYFYIDTPLDDLGYVRTNSTVFLFGENHIGGSLFGSGNYSTVYGNSSVETYEDIEEMDYVAGNVYGGGNEAATGGDATVNLKMMKVGSEGEQDVEHGSVFGGGKGRMFNTNEDPANPDIYTKVHDLGKVGGNATVTIGEGCQVFNNVYGGGEYASVGNPEDMENTGLATVSVTGGEVGPLDMTGLNAYVYGGGQGVADDENSVYKDFANVNKAIVTVNMPMTEGNRVWGSLFGGGADGHVLGDAQVNLNSGIIGTDGITSWDGNIFGGGRNYLHTNKTAGRVGGNITVNMSDGWLKGSIFGGGRLGLTGVDINGDTIGNPNASQNDYDFHLKHGYVTVNVSGGTVGYETTGYNDPINATVGQVFGGGKGIVDEAIPLWPHLAKVKGTNITISGTARIWGSVYGGGETAPTLNGTYVKIQGGLIGTEYGTENVDCRHRGSVYGGGKGTTERFWVNYPNDVSIQACQFAGQTLGKVKVEMSGGQVLENVFGGGQIASVGDTIRGRVCPVTVTMTGGQVGPLDMSKENAYVYGGSQGVENDENSYYRKVANVDNTLVTIDMAKYDEENSGNRILGSVFGGGADGHVLGDAVVNFNDGTIGTDGSTSWDGNIFGGGRNFSGANKSAGRVGGNVNIEMKDGMMYGCIYGGGRLGSVGVDVDGNMQTDVEDNPETGQNETANFGHITININGGTIGNENNWETDHTTSGNVYGGGMGRLTKLDDSTNPIWPYLAKVKKTNILVKQVDNSKPTVINNSVYGGGELGTVDDDATISVESGSVMCDVYGGGYGSNDIVRKGDIGTSSQSVWVTPLQMAGRVGGNTNISISGGWVRKSVYGGGEFATVGQITDSIRHNDIDVNDHIIHHPFLYSWPYEFAYADGSGTVTINITGGRIGITGSDEIGGKKLDNGDVYGGGKGFAALRYLEAHCANVKNTEITINIESEATPENYNADLTLPCIAGALYGGAENGHVNEDTHITLTKGLIGHNVYGGGKGKDMFHTTLLYPPSMVQPGGPESYETDIYSITAGKVYGNTRIDINGGYVVRSVFGGGNLASVGKGNYAGGVNDYSARGYGERVTNNDDWSDAQNSGHTYVNVNGGQFGMLNPQDPDKVFKDDIPYGSVFGGSRGIAVNTSASSQLTPRILYFPEHYLGYSNYTHVNITQAEGKTTRLYGSVYGGGQDGHVRWNTDVQINGGEIGANYGLDVVANDASVNNDPTSVHWEARGNVYGAGSGIGMWDSNNNGEDDSYCNIAGSVTQFTSVNVNGGIVHRNVYGGGNLATVGPPRIWQDHDCRIDSTCVVVNINAPIGQNQTNGYGGNVFGGSRGKWDGEYDFSTFAFCPYTKVNVNETAVVPGSVYGGGELGPIGISGDKVEAKHDTEVNIRGAVGGNVFGGGKGMVAVAPAPLDVTKVAKVHGSTEVFVKKDSQSATDPSVGGSVFGGGEDGMVWSNTKVTIANGTVGVDELVNDDPEIGNVYGGGRGIGQFVGDNNSLHYLATAGMVEGNSSVTVSGGHVNGNVYGGGELASVGKKIGDNADPNSGWARVKISGDGTVIGTNTNVDNAHGNVFGASRGVAGEEYQNFAYVNNTLVTLANPGAPVVKGSIYGSGDDGHVLLNTQVTINNANGKVGLEGFANTEKGNVYGGGRGVNLDANGNLSPSAGLVKGHTKVNIFHGQVFGDVFGGGNKSAVVHDKLVNVYGSGVVYGSVYGGSKAVPRSVSNNTGFKTVNVRETCEIKGNVYGCSYDVVDGNPTAPATDRTAFINIDGGKIGGNVYGAGWTGEVKGSVSINIGANAIKYTNNGVVMPRDIANIRFNDSGGLPIVVLSGVSDINTVTRKATFNSFLVDEGAPSNQREMGICWSNSLGTLPTPDGPHAQATDYTVGNYSLTVEGLTGDTYYVRSYAKNGDYGIAYSPLMMLSMQTNGTLALVPDDQQPDNAVPTYDPVAHKLTIDGSVYGGSNHIGSDPNSSNWEAFDITGHSYIIIDGSDYNTQSNDPDVSVYMNIGGGLYGCGTHCESGKQGRHIFLKDYGKRTPEGDAEMTSATRTLTTIQRCDNVLLANSNVNLSGNVDISGHDHRNYAVLLVDKGLYMAEASALNLGATNQPAYMDSIRMVRSVLLKGNSADYTNPVTFWGTTINSDIWDWVGIKGDSPENAKLYRIVGATPSTDPLYFSQENVLLFQGDSRLWVRYHEKKEGDTQVKQYYGELNGFFRMKSPFEPYGMESFAYARPKLTPNVNPITGYDVSGGNTWNKGDGGFLSYEIRKNFFTQKDETVPGFNFSYPVEGNDGGAANTNTKQYPYFNIGAISRADNEFDMEEYRQWNIPRANGKNWYVDGRGINSGGWGKNENHQDGWGHFPDKPKLTITGEVNNTNGQTGVCFDEVPGGRSIFDKENDIIFVVGPIEALLENENLNRWPAYPLKLFRYPGGHEMSNQQIDATTSEHPSNAPTETAEHPYEGLEPNVTAGPGANKGMMIHANKTTGNGLVMENVIVDGLYQYDSDEKAIYGIPNSFAFEKGQVNRPMVVTASSSKLKLMGGSVLKRGYNNTDATVWYYDADYSGNGLHGGAVYVDANATVNVEGRVSITGNKQMKTRTIPSSGGEPTIVTDIIESNVYLPTFAKYLNITGDLTGSTIGITSPIRNKESNYVYNTFSPVAVAASESVAQATWANNNFYDDLDWFFYKEGANYEKRTTYYSNSINDHPLFVLEPMEGLTQDDRIPIDPHNTIFFGWTWANVVRKEPLGFRHDEIDSPDELAWVISEVNGLNGEEGHDLAGVSMAQTKDIDLQQYVWVPIGYFKEFSKPFCGTFDGRGHLITNMDIDYIGSGDERYNYTDFGLFGYLYGNTPNQGVINRTFVVSGLIRPEGTANIGGLVGRMRGLTTLVSNSEAAVRIHCPDMKNSTEVGAGGLVGKMHGGTVHSSMAMPYLSLDHYFAAGGLVGYAESFAFESATKVPEVKNSFANAKYEISNQGQNTTHGVGGLVGTGKDLELINCYSHLYDHNMALPEFRLFVANREDDAIVSKCYGFDSNYDYCDNNNHLTDCHKYTPVISADELGYMYSDNTVTIGETTRPLSEKLNDWVGSSTVYSKWARPALAEINHDLPVLMLCDESATNIASTNEFRSLGTYSGGPALQYGGTVRDGEGKQLSEALMRKKASDANDCLFVYGDISEITDLTADDITQTKVSIYEHAAIANNNTLKDFANTYVGITFDNSFGHATSTSGVNHIDSQELPRDWHMFSTPLQNAPLGFNYWVNGVNTNEKPYSGGDGDIEHYYNNPWPYLHQQAENKEFFWLNGPGTTTGDNRYWMKNFDESAQSTDGYFPTQRGALFSDPTNVSKPLESEINELFIVGSDECPTEERNRYPYGMDLYCWYEAQPHWINFKRNGPNHWHSDEYDTENQLHAHLPYTENGKVNQNEDNLVKGKGYMASIAVKSFLQSHGMMNDNSVERDVTCQASELKGWNLVGNPYHGYLDFDKLVEENDIGHNGVLGQNKGNYFYVVYDADQYESKAYVYYPKTGSQNGEYAGQYLHPHQGFYVKAAKTGNLVFKESMIVTRSALNPNDEDLDGHFRGRSWDDDRPAFPLVNLYLSSEQGCADVTVIEFERPEWSGALKMKELRQGNGLFYAQHDNTHYAALFAKEGAERVPLWFEAKEDDVFTIKWNTANGDFLSMYLIDNLTGVTYDMLTNDSYTFEGHVGDYPSRFYIVFKLHDDPEEPETQEEPESDGHHFAFFDGSQWVVTGDGMLDFIDLHGHILSRYDVHGQRRVSLPVVASGMYLFRLSNSEEVKLQKIIVNNQ